MLQKLQGLLQVGHLIGGDFEGIGGQVFCQNLPMIRQNQTPRRSQGHQSHMIVIGQLAKFGIMQYLQVHYPQNNPQDGQEHQQGRHTQAKAKTARTFQ